MKSESVLRALLWLMGVATVLIGIYHIIGGIVTVPGTGDIEGMARATVDSRERFYNAIFIAYGLAWIWAARQTRIPTTLVHWLTGLFLLGGIGRVLSVLVYGWPHWFQIPLAALELGLPAVYFALTESERRRQVAGAAH